MSVRLLTLAAVLAASAALSGCGKAGALERPGPLFGATRADAPPPPDRDRDPSRPVKTVDPRHNPGDLDDATNPAPPRTVPIEGQNPTASDPGPPGVLPNPYNDPR